MNGRMVKRLPRYFRSVALLKILRGSSEAIILQSGRFRKSKSAGALVFVDESLNTVDDGFFAIQLDSNVSMAKLSNGPGIPMEPCCRFADAHAERWSWKG